MVGFEPTASRFQNEHSGRTELHPVTVGRGSVFAVVDFMMPAYYQNLISNATSDGNLHK